MIQLKCQVSENPVVELLVSRDQLSLIATAIKCLPSGVVSQFDDREVLALVNGIGVVRRVASTEPLVGPFRGRCVFPDDGA